MSLKQKKELIRKDNEMKILAQKIRKRLRGFKTKSWNPSYGT